MWDKVIIAALFLHKIIPNRYRHSCQRSPVAVPCGIALESADVKFRYKFAVYALLCN